MPEYCHRWYIGDPNKLDSNKTLRARDEMTAGSKTAKTDTKIEVDIQVLPDITEHDDKRMAKLTAKVTVRNHAFHRYQWVVTVHTTLYDPEANLGVLGDSMEERNLSSSKNHVSLLMNLAPQEKIERSQSKTLDVRVRVKVCAYRPDRAEEHQTLVQCTEMEESFGKVQK